MSHKTFTKILLTNLSFLFTLSCGVDQQVLTDFSYDIKDDNLDLQVELSSNLGINTELNIPILDYGSFTLKPPKLGKGFTINGKLNFKYLDDEKMLTIGKTRLLPNDQTMPEYTKQDLVSIRAEENEVIRTYVYLGSREQMYLGTALELSYINQHFPAGIVINVKLKDKKDRQVGVFAIFGPNVNEQGLVSPGGFYFMTNVSDLKVFAKDNKSKSETSTPSSPRQEIIEVNEAYQKEYQDPFKVSALLQLFQSLGRNASYVD